MKDATTPVILDTTAGLRHLAGDRGLYQQIMTIFFTETEGQLERIQQALALGNVEPIQQIAHGMKGAAGNLGAFCVQDTAEELEALAKARDLEKARPLFERLKDDVGQLFRCWQTEQAQTSR